MVTGRNMVLVVWRPFFRNRKCIFCGSFLVVHISRGYVKGQICGKGKNLSRLLREITILQGFYQLQSAYRLGQSVAIDVEVVTRVYLSLRKSLYHWADLEGASNNRRSNWTKPSWWTMQRKTRPNCAWQECRLWAPGV